MTTYRTGYEGTLIATEARRTTPAEYEDQRKYKDATRWRRARDYWTGALDDATGDLIAQRFPDEAARNTIQPLCLRLMQWYADMAYPAVEEAIFSDALPADLIDRIIMARRIAGTLGFAALHAARRGGRLQLDVLWGDQITAAPNPDDPTSLQACMSVTIATGSGELQYYRQTPGGPVRARVVGATAKELDGYALAEYPIFPIYRDPPHVAPIPRIDMSWLAAQDAVTCLLADWDLHMHYLIGQRVEEGSAYSDAEIMATQPVSPGIVAKTEMGGRIYYIAPPQSSTHFLVGVEKLVKLLLVAENFPPDVFEVSSYSQTGAARVQDDAKTQRKHNRDAVVTRRMLTAMMTWLQYTARDLQLEMGPLSVEVPPPPAPSIGDPAHEAMALRDRAKLGVESLVGWYARRNRLGRDAAEAEVLANLIEWEVLHGAQDTSEVAQREEARDFTESTGDRGDADSEESGDTGDGDNPA